MKQPIERSDRTLIRGASDGKSRDGEAEEVANSVGRESVGQGRTPSNTANKSRARRASETEAPQGGRPTSGDWQPRDAPNKFEREEK